MRIGRTLQELAIEVDRQRNARRDFVASTKDTEMVVYDDGTTRKHQLVLGNEHYFNINTLAHDQIASHAGIPAKYYRRMQEEAPELLRDSVNTWFRKEPAKRMIRTLDGTSRAFLSDSYRPLDNDALLEAALPALSDLGVELLSCEVTERRLYLKAIDRRVERDVPTGRRIGDGSHVFFDTCSPAIVITNSEVGLGALSVNAGVYTRMCTNLAVFGERSVRKYHVGRKAELGEEAYAMLSDDTRRLTDAALWAQIGDVVRGAFNQARFDAHIEQLTRAAGDALPEDDVVKVVEVTADRLSLNGKEKNSVLAHLIRGGDLSRYGLHAAVTRAAEDNEDYDRASLMERAGGQIIELGKHEWTSFVREASNLKIAA